jgi:hypothetical protein
MPRGSRLMSRLPYRAGRRSYENKKAPTILKTIELLATADARSVSATSDGTSASRAGWLNATTMPWKAVRATSMAMFICPLAVSANRVVACNSEMVWLVFTTRRRSQRSAAAPAIGPMSSTGKKSAKATIPSHKPDFVISQVSYPMAILCIHIPMRDTALPAE